MALFTATGTLRINPREWLALALSGESDLSFEAPRDVVPLSLSMGASIDLASGMPVSGSSMSVFLPRPRYYDPDTGRQPYRLILTDVAGKRYADLHTAVLGEIEWVLNDIGSFNFDMHSDDPKIKDIIPTIREVQVWRGANVEWWGVIVRASSSGEVVSFQCLTLEWYFTRRVTGLIPTPDLLKNGSFEEGEKFWNFRYLPGSSPALPPLHGITGVTISGKKALQISGADKIEEEVTVLGSDLTFNPGLYDLSDDGKQAIESLMDTISGDEPELLVEGHTDNVPHWEPGGNETLSLNRAEVVGDYIKSLRPGAVVTTVGHADDQPVATNNTAEGRKANRRVEVTYTKISPSKGHRQFASQAFRYTNPVANKVKKKITLVGWTYILTYFFPSKDGWGVYMERRDTDTGKVLGTTHVAINDETPRERWIRMECSLEVPNDGKEYIIEARLYPPSGTSVWDEISVTAADQLGFYDEDQSFIVQTLTEHAQDPLMGKSDLRIVPACPSSGVKRTREYPFDERQEIWESISEFPTLYNGLDVAIDFDQENRWLRTYFPRKGRMTKVVLALGVNISTYDVDIDGQQTSSTVVVQAEGEGSDREEGVVQDATALEGVVLETVYNASPGSAISSLQSQAERGFKRYGKPVVIPSVTMMSSETDDLLDRVVVGDMVRVVILDGWVQVDDIYRVTGRRLNPQTDQLSYTLSPYDQHVFV